MTPESHYSRIKATVAPILYQHRATLKCASAERTLVKMCNFGVLSVLTIEDGLSLSLNDNHCKILARRPLTPDNNVTC